MRKTLVALLTTLSIACLPIQSYAAKGGEKGPSERAYERASDKASFKREGSETREAEHRYTDDSDLPGHDENDKDDDSDGRKSKRKDDNDTDDDSDNRKSKKKDDDDKDESDSDNDVKSKGKKDRKEKKNKK